MNLDHLQMSVQSTSDKNGSDVEWKCFSQIHKNPYHIYVQPSTKAAPIVKAQLTDILNWGYQGCWLTYESRKKKSHHQKKRKGIRNMIIIHFLCSPHYPLINSKPKTVPLRTPYSGYKGQMIAYKSKVNTGKEEGNKYHIIVWRHLILPPSRAAMPRMSLSRYVVCAWSNTLKKGRKENMVVGDGKGIYKTHESRKWSLLMNSSGLGASML